MHREAGLLARIFGVGLVDPVHSALLPEADVFLKHFEVGLALRIVAQTFLARSIPKRPRHVQLERSGKSGSRENTQRTKSTTHSVHNKDTHSTKTFIIMYNTMSVDTAEIYTLYIYYTKTVGTRINIISAEKTVTVRYFYTYVYGPAAGSTTPKQ